ncbi:MAG: hypothetical protein JRS35_19415 [Deltaproteobacteria bacterium]|nr:hypothetical protein [Deltaproteobacteria bacterium]
MEFSGVRTDGEIALVKLNPFDEVEYFALIQGGTLSHLGNELANQAERGDYFGVTPAYCSDPDACAKSVAAPALTGWGFAALVVLLFMTAVVGIRSPGMPPRTDASS